MYENTNGSVRLKSQLDGKYRPYPNGHRFGYFKYISGWKDTESITRTHGFGLFVMVTSYFNSNNYKHTVTFTRNLLEAAFCGLFFLQKSIPQKCGMLNKINHNIQGSRHLLHYYYCFHNYLLKQWLDIRLYTHW